MILTAAGIGFVGALVAFMFLHDLWFAMMVQWQEREKAVGQALPELKSGVV